MSLTGPFHGPRFCWFPNCRASHRAPSADQANPGKSEVKHGLRREALWRWGRVQRDHRELRCWKRGGRRESGVWLPFLLGFLSSTRSQGSFCLTVVWKTDHIQHKAPTEGVQLSDCFRNVVVQSSPRSALDLYPLAIIPLPPSPNSKKSQVFLWGKTVEGLRVSFQDLVKGQSTLECVGLRQPRPAELTLCCPWPHISGLQIGWKQNQSPCLSPDRSPCVTSWSLPPSFR